MVPLLEPLDTSLSEPGESRPLGASADDAPAAAVAVAVAPGTAVQAPAEPELACSLESALDILHEEMVHGETGSVITLAIGE